MLKSNKITVSWIFGVPIYYHIDFGLFKAHKKNQIKVSKELWKQYTDIRLRYEILQKQLFNEIDKQGRNKLK